MTKPKRGDLSLYRARRRIIEERKRERNKMSLETSPCPVCGRRFANLAAESGHISHHSRRSDDLSAFHFCTKGNCTSKFFTDRALAAHVASAHSWSTGRRTPKDRRAERAAFIESIRRLPYRQFVELVEAPWPQ